MTMEATPRWDLPHLFAGQAQKEIFHNEALARIDMLLHGRVESDGQVAPPAEPEAGQCWVVGDAATGAWVGRDGDVACWTEGGWRFARPKSGLVLWVTSRGHELRYDGVTWRAEAVRADGIYIDGKRVVGPQAAAVTAPMDGMVVDGEGRAAIASILTILRTHGLIAT